MKLVLGYGGGVGYYPYTMKPANYQPYRPIYLYRGPPPDAGFSYGLFEDGDTQEQYYAELGLDGFSPFTGKPAKLLQEIAYEDLQKANLDKAQMETCRCKQCASEYQQNFKEHMRGREEFYCHRCGARI